MDRQNSETEVSIKSESQNNVPKTENAVAAGSARGKKQHNRRRKQADEQ